jgi:hypothetical protein
MLTRWRGRAGDAAAAAPRPRRRKGTVRMRCALSLARGRPAVARPGVGAARPRMQCVAPAVKIASRHPSLSSAPVGIWEEIRVSDLHWLIHCQACFACICACSRKRSSARTQRATVQVSVRRWHVQIILDNEEMTLRANT